MKTPNYHQNKLLQNKTLLMKPSIFSLNQILARMLGLAFLGFLFAPPTFGAGVTVRLAAEPEGSGYRTLEPDRI